MMFDTYLQKIILALDNPLPGEKAHLEMMHSNRKFLENENILNYKPSAVSILIYPNDTNEPCILLIERTSYNGHHSGQIALPGGKQEPEDADLQATALREFFEETGCNQMPIVIGKLTPIYIPLSKFKVQPFVTYVKTKPLFKKQDSEVNALIEWKVVDFLMQDTQQITKIPVGEVIISANYFLVENKILWGATAMILNEFKKIIEANY